MRRAIAAWALASCLGATGCGSKTGLGLPAEARDSGPRLDAAGRDATVLPDTGTDAPRLDSGPDACAPVVVALQVTPTVLLLIDQSASMDAPAGGGRTRWTLVRDVLIGSGGLVPGLERRVRFGLSLYSARSRDGDDGGPPIGMCPLLTTVPPALDNLDSIRTVYSSAVPIEDTPTGDAIDETLARFTPFFDETLGPTILVLATDGEPDRCEQLDPQNGQDEAVSAARRAFASGIRTFVINLGEDLVSRRHLQDMANAGLGHRPGEPDAPFWEASSTAGLRSALDAIVRTEVACTPVLTRAIVPERACSGTVTLNGRPLPCDDPDGWRATDPTHLQLLGAACRELTDVPGSTLEARFPCEALAR